MKHKSFISIAMATIVLASLCAVCATSPSLSAAQSSSKASVQATPSLVGAPIAAGTSPAACMLTRTDLMYIFVKGYDGACWYRIWSLTFDGWRGNWASLGGTLTSSPTAVSHPGVIDIYVAGTNGAVYQTTLSYYSPSGWAYIGGQVAPGTGPAASGWSGEDDVFVEGTNGALYQNTWIFGSGWSSWSGWTNLGGQLTSSPAAVSRSSGLIDVYVRGTNGAVYGKEYRGGSWFDWFNFGGQVAPGTGPAACSYSSGRHDIFVEGTNGALYQQTLDASSGGWLPSWTSLGGKLSASPTAATTTSGGGVMDMFVFVRGTNGLLYNREYFGGAWWPDWHGPYQGPP